MAKSDENLSRSAAFRLESVEETSAALDHHDRLLKVITFLEENLAPSDLVDTIKFCVEDNRSWIDVDIEAAFATGQLSRPTSVD